MLSDYVCEVLGKINNAWTFLTEPPERGIAAETKISPCLLCAAVCLERLCHGRKSSFLIWVIILITSSICIMGCFFRNWQHPKIGDWGRVKWRLSSPWHWHWDVKKLLGEKQWVTLTPALKWGPYEYSPSFPNSWVTLNTGGVFWGKKEIYGCIKTGAGTLIAELQQESPPFPANGWSRELPEGWKCSEVLDSFCDLPGSQSCHPSSGSCSGNTLEHISLPGESSTPHLLEGFAVFVSL